MRTSAYAILAGGEFSLPADSPSGRLDTEGAYSFVGALGISAGGFNYRGSAVALSPNWGSPQGITSISRKGSEKGRAA
jgi:hypothetical protein